MFPVKKVLLAAALTVTMGGMGLSPAKAATETWNFNNPTGPLGTTQNYLSSPDNLVATAAGFLSGAADPNTAGVFGTPGNLFGKNNGTDSSGSIENGLGLVSPPGGTDNEITAGISLIRVTIPTGLTGATAIINSVTGGEHYEIFGSTTGAVGSFQLVVFNASAQGTPQLLQTPGCALCTVFAFFAVGSGTQGAANILIGSISAMTSAVPLPGALVLFGSGLVGLAALGRRKRKQLEATAA